jgi:hypothetical protein
MTRSALWMFFTLGFFTSFSSVLAEETVLSKCIPKDDEVTGWVRQGKPYIAIDEETLFAFINGAAPFYIKHGTVEVGFQDYAQKDFHLTLEVYRMKDEESAIQLYGDIYAENPKPLINIGSAGRLIENLIGLYLIEYQRQSFFVRLTISKKSEASKEKILTFARIVSEKIDKL